MSWAMMENRYGDDKVFDACGLFGFIDTSGHAQDGTRIAAAIANMRERGNGLGAGYAAYGLYPAFADHYAFHVICRDEAARTELDAYLRRHFAVVHDEPIPCKQVHGILDPPLVWRYFLFPQRAEMVGRSEEDYVVHQVMTINGQLDGSFVVSSGKNMGIFKGVGHPEEIAEFYEKQLESLPGTVIQMLLGMMTCLDYGFAIMEKNYYFIKEGDYRGKTGLSSIKSKKPHDFRFEQDEFCNVEGLVQIQSKGEVKLPPSKFIRTTWMPEWENPYGTADLRAAYVARWQKDVILRFQAIWLERYPSPIMIGRYPPGTSQDDQDDLLEVLEDLQIHTEAIIPEGIVIEPIKMDRSGSDIYTKAIDKRDTMIGQAILIPELLGFTSRSTGSYALGKKQFDLFLGVLWHLGRTIEEVIHEQLTIPFIDWNYGVNEDYPEFEFEALAEEGAETKAKILATLASAGVIDPTDPETREWIGDYLSILPQTKTKASEMAQDALSFHDTFKFYSPKGDEVFEVEIMETAARMELLNDALQKTE